MPRSRGGRRTSRSCSVTLVASRNRCCGSTGAHSSSGLQLRGWSCKRFAARMMCTRGHGFGSTTSLVKSRETLRPVDSNLRGQRTFVLPRRRDAAFRRLRVASGQRADRYVAVGPNGTRFGTHARLFLASRYNAHATPSCKGMPTPLLLPLHSLPISRKRHRAAPAAAAARPPARRLSLLAPV